MDGKWTLTLSSYLFWIVLSLVELALKDREEKKRAQ